MRIFRLILKWILIVFVAFSILLAARQCYQRSIIQVDEVSYDNLEPLRDGQIQLVLFHNKKRCHQCLTIEAHVGQIINEHFSDNIQDNTLAFKMIVIDEPENIPLVKKLGVFAATLVFMEFKSGELIYARVLERGPELYRKEAEFKAYLTDELSSILMLTKHE